MSSISMHDAAQIRHLPYALTRYEVACSNAHVYLHQSRISPVVVKMRTKHWDYCKITLKQLLKASCSSVKSSATVKRSPYGVLIDGLIEEQDVEAEDANQEGMERGHSPAETQKPEVLSHDNS